ncbi:MAG: GHKL domain-containing protein, partial [Clostridiales bacterium]|nr:GHKL domain-containing protein [Clostridiales bacterium]
SKHFTLLFMFPVLSIASLTVFLFIALKTDMPKSYQIAIAIISIIYIFACIFIFIYYQILSDNEARINELEAEQNFYKLNNTYLDILKHQNDELQIMFHDTKHHYFALSNFDSIDEVKEYINKIYPDLESKNTIQISKNKILDLILNKYIIICKQKQINFSYEVKTSDLNYIDNSELSIILNNALDNAVEATLQSEEKVIEFSLRHINNMDMLSIVNNCDISPLHSGGKLLSTKSNSANHGFGTKIIEKHVNINNGKYDWFYDKTERRFHLSILFQK